MGSWEQKRIQKIKNLPTGQLIVRALDAVVSFVGIPFATLLLYLWVHGPDIDRLGIRLGVYFGLHLSTCIFTASKTDDFGSHEDTVSDEDNEKRIFYNTTADLLLTSFMVLSAVVGHPILLLHPFLRGVIIILFLMRRCSFMAVICFRLAGVTYY